MSVRRLSFAALFALAACGGGKSDASDGSGSGLALALGPTPPAANTAAPSTQSPVPAPSKLAPSVGSQHPRVLITPAIVHRLQGYASSSDPALVSRHANLIANATKDLAIAPPSWTGTLGVGDAIYNSSRGIIEDCALAWQVTRDARYADRAIAELMAIASFPTWFETSSYSGKPSSDVLRPAIAVRSMLLGYDWMFEALTEAQRRRIREAVRQRFLTPAEAFYAKGDTQFQVSGNHGEFAAAGMALAALVFEHDDPAGDATLATDLAEATQNLQAVQFGQMVNGGAMFEGPSYLLWGMQPAVSVLPALQTAMPELALFDTPGVESAATLATYIRGPTRWEYPYADAEARTTSTQPAMLWLASHYRSPAFAWQYFSTSGSGSPVTAHSGAAAETMILYDPEVGVQSPAAVGLTLTRVFPGVQIGFLRSAWDDPDAAFLAAKGGDNARLHTHRDLGSFVLDMGGQRWIEDLGRDTYTKWPTFGDYQKLAFRTLAESHATLRVDGVADQASTGKASIDSPSDDKLVVDASGAYPTAFRRWIRTFRLIGAREATVDDQWAFTGSPMGVTWSAMTYASIQLNGAQATLTLKDHPSGMARQMQLTILQPAGATFFVDTPTLTALDDPNTGADRFNVHLAPGAGQQVTVNLRLTN